jgi:RND family efflux transporter MFP subunit
MDGRVSRRFLDVGNLVKADETPLTTVVSKGQMAVSFEVSAATVLRLRRAKLTPTEVKVGLPDENGFPHTGKVDFIDNVVSEKTGTLAMRASVANKDDLLLPGLFVRIRLNTSAPYKALLVPEEAVATDKGQASVLVVNDKNVVERRPVTLGTRQDRFRVVKEGLRSGDWVVTSSSGAQKLSPGMKVKPRK